MNFTNITNHNFTNATNNANHNFEEINIKTVIIVISIVITLILCYCVNYDQTKANNDFKNKVSRAQARIEIRSIV